MVLFASLICVAIAQGPTTPLSGTVIGPERRAGGRCRAGARGHAGVRPADPRARTVGRGGPVPARSSGRAGGPEPRHRPDRSGS